MSDPIRGRHRRWRTRAVSVVTAVSLFFSCLIGPGMARGAAVEYPEAETGEKPKITIEGNLVIDELKGELTGFYEVALKVAGGATSEGHVYSFRYLGVSLQYDEALLAPVTWDCAAKEDGTIAPDIPVSGKTQLPTKKSDVINSEAAVYPGGLFYIWAENTFGTDQVFAGDTIAVVRFAIKDFTPDTPQLALNKEDPDDPLTWTVVKADGNGTELVNPLVDFCTQDKAADTDVGELAWYRNTHTTFYYTTETPVTPTALSMESVNPADDTYQNGDINGNSSIPDGYPDVSLYAAARMLDHPNLLAYDPDNKADSDIYFNYVSTTSYVPGSGISLDDVRVAVCLGWNSEFIGAIVLAKGIADTTVAQEIDKVTKTIYEGYDPENKPLQPSLALNQGPDDTTPYDKSTDTATYPLTCHKGYNFAGWVMTPAAAANDLWTTYEDKAECIAAITPLADIMTALETGNVVFKAAFLGNEELDKQGPISTSAERDWYVASDFMYSRIGSSDATTGNYSIKFFFSRENRDGYGVTRLREMGIKQTYTIDGVEINMLATIDSKDEQQIELVAPKQASKLSFVIVDMENVISYLSARVGSSTYIVNKIGESETGQGFVVEASFELYYPYAEAQFLKLTGNTVAVDTTWKNVVNYVLLCDVGLEDAMRQMSSPVAATATETTKAALARNLLSIYMVGKGTHQLTLDQMRAAIKMNTGSEVGTSTLVSGVRTHVNNVKAAIAENEKNNLGPVLTTAQITYAVVNGAWASPQDALNAFPNDIDA